jgi:hypothetical protein
MVLLDFLVLQEPLDSPAIQGQVDQLAHLVLLALPDSLERLDHLEIQVNQEL